MARPRWPYPIEPGDGKIVTEAESVVRAIQLRYQKDVAALTRQVVGKSGRPFMTVPLSPEERQAAFDEMRDVDDPELWAKQLEGVKSDPAGVKRLIKQWQEHEEEWRKGQQQAEIANFPGATLQPPTPTETPPDAGQPIPGSTETGY